MSGRFTQVGARSALNIVNSSLVSAPASASVVRNYNLRLWQAHAIAMADYLPVAFLNEMWTQARADDAGGTWLTALIAGRVDTSGDLYIALLTADPGAAAVMADVTAVEVSASGYSRQIPVWGLAVAQADGSTTAATTAPMFFGPFPTLGGVGPVTHAAMVTGASGSSGACVMTWAFDVAGSAAQNQSLTIPAGSLTMRVT